MINSQYTDSNLSSQSSRLCLWLTLFPSAFDKVHEHFHAGLHIAQYIFNQYIVFHVYQNGYQFSFLTIDCQKHKYKSMKQNKAAILPFSKLSTFPNHSISMDTKGPINPASEGNHYFCVIFDLFSNYIVTVPTPKNNAYYAVNSLNHPWISKFGPPYHLITDRGTEYLNPETANCSTMLNFGHSPRTSHAPWTKWLEVPIKNLGTHLRMFLYDTPENWSLQKHLFAYAHSTQPLSHLHVRFMK